MRMPGQRARCVTKALVVALLAVSTSGCGIAGFTGLHDVPLPGGADLGAHPIQVTVYFDSALDLVPQSGVRVNDVAVGQVQRIELAGGGRKAKVTLLLNGTVRLPDNAVARLRQTSILGAKFVELAAPRQATPIGQLGDGDTITLARANLAPEIEEVLGAMSLLLNGGGIAQIQNISEELNAALRGNESAAREMLDNLEEFTKGLDEHKADITTALDALDKLTATLRGHTDEISTALSGLTPGIEVLADQRAQLTTMLKSLDKLTDVAVRTVRRASDDIVADLRALVPILRNLAEAGAALPRSMEMLLTYPFPDSVLGAIKGDYLNAFMHLDSRTGGGAN